MEIDVTELDFPLGDLDGRGIGRVLYLRVDVKQVKHVFHVNKCLLDHPIISAKEVEWRVKLDDVSTVEDKVTDVKNTLGDSKSTEGSSN